MFAMHPPLVAAPCPDGLSEECVGSTLVIAILWRNMASWALLPLGLVASAIPVILFLELRVLPWNDPIQLIVLVFALVGIIFAYNVIRRMVNVTRLEITPQRIRISHDPLPWRRPFEIDTVRILSVATRPYHLRYSGNVATHYHVWLLLDNCHQICLLERDTTKKQADHVRDAIQRVLAHRTSPCGSPEVVAG